MSALCPLVGQQRTSSIPPNAKAREVTCRAFVNESGTSVVLRRARISQRLLIERAAWNPNQNKFDEHS
jgi:hypothetical protein